MTAATLLFFTRENGLVIVCPEVELGQEGAEAGDVGGTFWPVFYGGAFCGLTYDELRAAGNGTIAVDETGAARIRK